MTPIRFGVVLGVMLGLVSCLASGAFAQVTFTESGTGGCTTVVTSSGNHTDCASATFSLMTGGTGGTPGSVVSGKTATNVTGIQIVIRNTTPATMNNYLNQDLLTGFFWGLNPSFNNPTLATTGSGNSKSVNGSAIATNSLGGQAAINQGQCNLVSCAGTSVNVGAYWDSSYKVGGWTGGGLTFPGAYAVATSGYTSIALGGGTNIGAGDPSYTNGNSSNAMSLVGGAGGSGISFPASFPLIQDTVTIQLAFSSTIASFNLDNDIVAADVYFTYGTAPDSASAATKAFEPASIALFGVGTLGLGLVRRRKRG